ncbi:MAG: potassium/hydrogen antiporter [Frankiales bacterium]|nr:potassium/hydrogen antiporter [Frankiales bacterium]
MHDATTFGWIVLAYAAVGLAAVLSNRLSERLALPTPALFLAAAAVTATLAPSVHHLPQQTVQRLVTVALVVILFDGGLHLGLRRVRGAAAPILLAGVPGTFLTAVAAGLIAHAVFGWSWWVSLLLGTAIAPTDPAVVFSVLGKREVEGRTGTILEGESGANDPVGIALMAGLLSAGGVSLGALGGAAGEFALQMLVGAAVGIVGGQALLAFMRRVSLPSEGLDPLRTLAGAMILFGLASVLHGSGFLAVFVAGILLGDEEAPYKREVERFHSALASLGEIVAFIVLGLTVDLSTLGHRNVLVPGLVLAAALTFVIRPLAIALCLGRVSLSGNERSFVLWAGLKGAVPILLGSYLLAAPVPDPPRLYGVVVIVVAFSVVVQGGLVPFVAGRLKIPMRAVEPEPWSLGVRLQDQPSGVRRFTVEPGSAVEGRAVGDLDDLWVSIVIRNGALLPVRKDTRLAAGDDVLVQAGTGAEDIGASFAAADCRVPAPQTGTTPAVDSSHRTPVTPADLEAVKERLQWLAGEVAQTDDRIADTFEQLAATGGDPDGHRRRIADEARRAAEAERRKAMGSDPSRKDV